MKAENQQERHAAEKLKYDSSKTIQGTRKSTVWYIYLWERNGHP